MKRAILILLTILAVPCVVDAGTYWVSPTGAAAWGSCSGETPLNGAAACPLSTANSSAVAGDTVYLRGGTYTVNDSYGVGIQPSNSGTSGSKITFTAYTGETPTILKGTGSDGWGVLLSGKSYIKLDGITFRNWPRWGTLMNFAHHNEIVNCTFTSDTGEEGWQGLWIVEGCSGGASYLCPSTHNWIHGNTFYKLHTNDSPSTCVEGADLVRVGYDNTTGDTIGGNDYNTIENNVMYQAGHTTFDGYGMYTVFRNNTMHNEPWWTSAGGCDYPTDQYSTESFKGKFGHRTFQITDGFARDATYNLIEGNRSGFGSTNPNNNGADGMDIAAPRNIIRYNGIFAAMNSCMMFKYGWGISGGNGGTYNRAYNNTLYHCGYGNPGYEVSSATCTSNGWGNCSTYPQALLAVRWYVDETVGNILKNNLIYDSRRYAITGHDIGFGVDSSSPAGTVLTNNWLTSNGDPKFTDTTLTDPTSLTKPDLSLQSSSTAIDGGTYLTQANGSGTGSTTLVVDDALYFQDGTWGSDLTRTAGTMLADWIAIGTVTNVVQISSIDYSTNTITLASPMTWADDAHIWLYKKSDGTRVLYGSAPDYGAYEYPSSPTTYVPWVH